MVTELTSETSTASSDAGRLRGRKLIFVLGWLELGGAERQAIQTARYLRDAEGAEVAVWGFESPGRAMEMCSNHNIPCRHYPFRWEGSRQSRLAELWRLARALRAERPSALLPYCATPNVTCGLVWRWTGARTCLWNQRDDGSYLVGSRWERWALRNSPLVVCNTEVHATRLAAKYGIHPARLHVVPNGVALATAQSSREEWRVRIGIPADAFAACMLAKLQWPKDHETLLYAWGAVVDRLRTHGQDAVLLLAGRVDAAGDRAKALAFDLKLGSSVRFLGHINDVAGLLDAADLGVFSSRNEGCPNGVLECMAAGLSVVATDIEGIREAVGPTNFPYLAPPGDDELLARQIILMAEDANLRRTIGHANQDRIARHFSPELLGRRMAAILSPACSVRQ